MHVDDRLATVLNIRADSKVAARIQYRQLLDLVGTNAAASEGAQIDQALARLAELAQVIPPVERARALAEPGVRLRNPRLVADLAADHLTVALAAIRAARLTEAEWLDLVPALPLTARGLVRHRRDLGAAVEQRLEQFGIADRGLPAGDAAEAVAAAAPRPSAPPPPSPAPAPAAEPLAPAPPLSEAAQPEGIGALVRRIEAFQRHRQTLAPPVPANDSPLLPLGVQEYVSTPLQAFSFSTDTAGRVGWTDAVTPGMLVGLLLPLDDDARERFRLRLPLEARSIDLGGPVAIAGQWQLDALPDFDDAGHFTGYLGRCRRPAVPAAPASTHPEADRIRQVLHELRTPVNAIQGFAEVIQQQLFGATPHEYRALAASIAGDAARMLAGFEELDRWARLDAGALEPDAGTCDFAMVVAGLIHQLEPFTSSRGSGFVLDAEAGESPVALTAADAERLTWRLLATLAGLARPGETMALTLRRDEAGTHLRAVLPEALAGLTDPAQAPAAPGAQAISAGVFGTAFTLRLAAAEAAAAGGRLELADGVAHLQLPGPTAPAWAGERDSTYDKNLGLSSAG